MKTTKEAVIKATSDLADEKGLNNVSLKAVAQKLNIRTPSLYNHIESLDNLLLEVAHNGMRDMNERMMKIAVGKIGKEAFGGFGIVENIGLIGALIHGGTAQFGKPDRLRLRHPCGGRAALHPTRPVEMRVGPPGAQILVAKDPRLARGAVCDRRADLCRPVGR